MGATLLFELTAAMALLPLGLARAYVRVSVVRDPLVARIAGGDRRVDADATTQLDASGSSDPSAEAGSELSFAWTVLAQAASASSLDAGGFGECALAGSGAPVALNASDASGPLLRIPAGALQPLSAYWAVLTVSSALGPRSACAVVALSTLAAGSPPTPLVAVSALGRAKYSAVERVAVRVLSVELPDQASLALVLAASGVAANASDALARGLTGAAVPWAFAWAVAGLDLSDPAVAPTGGAGESLVLLPGSLAPGGQYALELRVSAPGSGVQLLRMALRVGRPPFGGGLSVSPLRGQAASTVFALSAPAWQPEDEDARPLLYAFDATAAECGAGAEAGCAPLLLGPPSALSELAALLPWSGNFSVSLAVVDTYSAVTRVSLSASVSAEEPAEALGAEALAALSAQLARASAAGDVSLVLALATALGRRSSQLASAGRRRLGEANASALNGTGELSAQLLSALLALEATAGLGSAHDATDSDGVGGASWATRLLLRARAQAAAAVVGPDAAALDPAGRLLAGALLGSLAGDAAARGLDQAGAALLAAALSALLAAGAASAAEGSADEGEAALQAARSLAAALAFGAVAGEGVREAAAGELRLLAARLPARRLGNSSLALGGGDASLGGVWLPPGVLGLQAGSLDGGFGRGVDLALLLFAGDVHRAARLSGAASASPGPATSVVAISLHAAAAGGGRGAELPVRGLAEPLRLWIPLELGSPSAAAGGAQCAFWAEALGAWATDGCIALEAPSAEAGNRSALGCACTHLTDFAGVLRPGQLAAVQAAGQSVQLNQLRAEDFARLAQVDARTAADNPYLFALLLGLAGCNALGLLCALRSDRQWALARRRAQEEEEREAAAAAAALGGGGAADGKTPPGSPVRSSRLPSAPGSAARSRHSWSQRSRTSRPSRSSSQAAVGGAAVVGVAEAEAEAESERGSWTERPPRSPPAPSAAAPRLWRGRSLPNSRLQLEVSAQLRKWHPSSGFLHLFAQAPEPGSPLRPVSPPPSPPSPAPPGASPGASAAHAPAPGLDRVDAAPARTRARLFGRRRAPADGAAGAAAATDGPQQPRPAQGERPLSRLARGLSRAVYDEHTISSLARCASRREVLREKRPPHFAQKTQTLFTLLAMQACVCAITFDADSATVGPPFLSPGPLGASNLASIFLNAIFVALIAAPCLALVKGLFALSHERTSPAMLRLFESLRQVQQHAKRAGASAAAAASRRRSSLKELRAQTEPRGETIGARRHSACELSQAQRTAPGQSPAVAYGPADADSSLSPSRALRERRATVGGETLADRLRRPFGQSEPRQSEPPPPPAEHHWAVASTTDGAASQWQHRAAPLAARAEPPPGPLQLGSPRADTASSSRTDDRQTSERGERSAEEPQPAPLEPRATPARPRLALHEAPRPSEKQAEQARTVEAQLEQMRWRLFDEADRDGSGEMDTGEVGALLAWLGLSLSAAELEQCIRDLDRDRGGKVSKRELEVWFEAQCRRQAFAASAGPAAGRWRRCHLSLRARAIIAWIVALGLFVAFSVLLAAYGRKWGNAKFSLMVGSWGLSVAQTFVIEEPLMIGGLYLLPVALSSLSENEIFLEIYSALANSLIARFVGACLGGLFGG